MTLLQASEALAASPGVDAAIVAMATPLNLELYERLGFDLAAIADATPNDLLVAVRAADDAAVDQAAGAELEALLRQGPAARHLAVSARRRRPGRPRQRCAAAARCR